MRFSAEDLILPNNTLRSVRSYRTWSAVRELLQLISETYFHSFGNTRLSRREIVAIGLYQWSKTCKCWSFLVRRGETWCMQVPYFCAFAVSLHGAEAEAAASRGKTLSSRSKPSCACLVTQAAALVSASNCRLQLRKGETDVLTVYLVWYKTVSRKFCSAVGFWSASRILVNHGLI